MATVEPIRKENVILSKDATSHEKLVHGFKVLLAKNYLDNLREEVLKGREEKIKEGGYPHKALVGYYNDTNKETKKKEIFVDEKKAKYVKKLFEFYATGAYSVDELRTILFNEGFNHKGRPYSKPRLLFVLKDVFYIGKMKINGVIYQGKHTPIIGLETFNRVQKMFNDSKARTHDVEFTYAGLIKCGHCGCQLTAELKKGKYVYYHCTGKRGSTCKKDYIREERLDEVFLELINKLPDPDKGLFEEIKKAVNIKIKKIAISKHCGIFLIKKQFISLKKYNFKHSSVPKDHLILCFTDVRKLIGCSSYVIAFLTKAIFSLFKAQKALNSISSVIVLVLNPYFFIISLDTINPVPFIEDDHPIFILA